VNIYVGNLPFRTTSSDLEELFAAHGTVSSANVIMDRETGRSRGFGFVELDDAAEAQRAIEALDGYELDGRRLRVNEARPRR
jgi:RNA recognition motif-containing protein